MKKYVLLTVFQFGFILMALPRDVAMDSIVSHPRILLLTGEEEQIKKNISNNSLWGKVQNEILFECDNIVTQHCLERKMTGRRLLSVSREALRRIFFLSYAYRTTNEQKYLKRAEEEMLSVACFEDWNPSHFLDVAEMTMAMAIGYDWLYNNLTETSRKTIKKAILVKGIEPSFNVQFNGFLQQDHNWNQVCNAGIVYGSLAIYEDFPEISQKVIDRAVNTIQLPMKNYGQDGAYAEGYGYWEYGTSFNVMLLAAFEKIYGTDFGLSSISGFQKTAAYYENMVGPSGYSFNYADCEENNVLSPAMFWFAKKNKDNSLLWNEGKLLAANGKKMIQNRLLPAAIIWGSNLTKDRISAPSNFIWIGQGTTPVALMRTSWMNPNAIFVGFKGGTASSNHAHMDVGSFVMEANGTRWAMDFGMQNYESLESKGINIWGREQDSQRWSVFRYNNFAHNTLTVNNQLHNVKGYSFINSYSSNADFISSVSDLSSVFDRQLLSCQRGIAIVNKQYVLIQDEIKTLPDFTGETKIRWSMLTSATVKVKNKNTMELQKGGKKLYVKVLGNDKIKLTTWTTKSKNNFDADNSGTTLIGFETEIPSNTTKILKVILLPENCRYHKSLYNNLNQWPKQ